VANLGIMKSLQPENHLGENGQDLLSREVSSIPNMFCNFLVQISIISILHDKAEALAGLIDERLLVLHYIGMADAREKPYLVESVLLVLL